MDICNHEWEKKKVVKQDKSGYTLVCKKCGKGEFVKINLNLLGSYKNRSWNGQWREEDNF